VKKCPSNGFNIAGSRLHPSLWGCADAALISLSFYFLSLLLLPWPSWWPLFNPDLGSPLHILCLNYCLLGLIFLLSYSSICNLFHRMCICCYFLTLFFSSFKPRFYPGLHLINLLLEVEEVKVVCCLASQHTFIKIYTNTFHKSTKTYFQNQHTWHQ